MPVVNRDQRPSMFLGTFNLSEIDNKFTLSAESIKLAKHGGRVVLPPSVLRRIVVVDAPSPFIIKIQLVNSKTETYCGVHSFEGKERQVLAPRWICDHIKATNRTRIKVYILTQRLPSGKLAKLKPLSIDFLDVMNPKKALENSLSHYTCLNVNNTIDISFIDKVYRMAIVHLEPETVIDITNCDLEIEFELFQENEANIVDQSEPFTAFSGHFNRLDGKELTAKQKEAEEQSKKSNCRRGIPDFKYELGTIKLVRAKTSTADVMYSKLKRASTGTETNVGKRKSTLITLRNSASNAGTEETPSRKRKMNETNH